MLEDLITFVDRTPTSYRISMPRLSSYIDRMIDYTAALIVATGKFTKDPIPSAGIDRINSMISRADIPYLLKYKSDTDRLVKVFREYRGAMYGDFFRQHPTVENGFIMNRNKDTVEYVMITDDFDLIDDLPFGSNAIEDWLNIRPLRMLTCDSKEILLDVVTSKFRYRQEPPTEVVFSLNIVKLLMAYTKYRILRPDDFILNTNNYPVIYRLCILPMLHDSLRCWILDMIMSVIRNIITANTTYKFRDLVIYGERSNFVLGGLQSAVDELTDAVDKCINGTIRADELLVSLPIDKNMSMLDYVYWVTDSHRVGSNGLQYRWANFIKEYPILSIMVDLYQANPDAQRSREFRKLFNIIARRYRNTTFWQHAGNPFINKGIRDKFDSLCNRMDY